MMLRIILLLLVVAVIVLLVPRVPSRSSAPSEGSSAPDFTLPSQEGSSVALKDYRGKWVVLYFYPRMKLPAALGRRTTFSGIKLNIRKKMPSF